MLYRVYRVIRHRSRGWRSTSTNPANRVAIDTPSRRSTLLCGGGRHDRVYVTGRHPVATSPAIRLPLRPSGPPATSTQSWPTAMTSQPKCSAISASTRPEGPLTKSPLDQSDRQTAVTDQHHFIRVDTARQTGQQPVPGCRAPGTPTPKTSKTRGAQNLPQPPNI